MPASRLRMTAVPVTYLSANRLAFDGRQVSCASAVHNAAWTFNRLLGGPDV